MADVRRGLPYVCAPHVEKPNGGILVKALPYPPSPAGREHTHRNAPVSDTPKHAHLG